MRKEVPCPQCKKLTPYEGNPFRPFCCERCKKIDLGDWASEKHFISTPADIPDFSLEEEINEDFDVPKDSTFH